ncbi:hypothetical protein [Burkholderia sola]
MQQHLARHNPASLFKQTFVGTGYMFRSKMWWFMNRPTGLLSRSVKGNSLRISAAER